MSNNLKHFRVQRQLTQRQLAELAATSQQQIQRIENGRTVPRIVLAQRIADAVGAPIDAVFPEISKALRLASKSYGDRTILNDSVLDNIAKEGLDADPRVWALRVLLRGHAEPVIYPIPAESKRRLRERLFEPLSNSIGVPFWIFDSGDMRVALNLQQISYCQFLFDVDRGETGDQSVPEEIRVRIAGSDEIHSFMGEPDYANPSNPDDLGELDDLLFYLAMPSKADQMLRFTDGDGEEVWLRVGDIAVLEIPLHLFAAGGTDDIDDESV